MTREEILQIAKPILFNTDMVRAILDNRKTATRRPVKCKYSNTHLEMFTNKYGTRLIEIQNDVEGETFGKNPDGTTWRRIRGYIETEYERKPYKKDDYLYVRETWSFWPCWDCDIDCNTCRTSWNNTGGCFVYRTQKESVPYDEKWRPSIHMPKEAARIFLRVTDVSVEQLRDMTNDDAEKEGCGEYITKSKFKVSPLGHFMQVWDFTVQKKDIDKYGWYVNPWVWVIEFERVEVQ